LKSKPEDKKGWAPLLAQLHNVITMIITSNNRDPLALCTGKKSIRLNVFLYVMMHVMYNIAFTATDVAYKIWNFLKANYLKWQVKEKFLNQVISN